METQEPQIIGEGAYGCVIKPGIDSQGNPDTVPGYISKIEIEKSTIDNEINISNRIKEIPDYEDRFSPILENAPLELGKINVKEINDCKIVEGITDRENARLEINKIKYVGKDTLELYLLNILEENPDKFIEILIDTHIYLLDSLTELNKVGIIHNDIKENNILCRDESGIPIMIDFGLSIESEYLRLPPNFFGSGATFEVSSWAPLPQASILGSLSGEKKGSHIYKYFFKYEPSYEVWCIELHILNYMLTELNREWLQSSVTQEQINYLLSQTKNEDRFSSYLNRSWSETILELNSKGNNSLLELIYEGYGYQWRTKKVSNLETIVNAYIEKNLIKLELFNTEELEVCRTNLLEFFSSYNDKNWEELFNDLISSQQTLSEELRSSTTNSRGPSAVWDNYALSIVYLKIIVSFGITQNEKIREYGELLKEIILSKPKERKTAEETKQAIKEVLQNVPKTIFSKIIDIVMGRKENHNSIKQSVVTKKIDELNRESVLYETKKLF